MLNLTQAQGKISNTPRVVYGNFGQKVMIIYPRYVVEKKRFL